MFLMHLGLCYFNIKYISAFPIWGREKFGSGWSNHRYGGSYSLKYLSKCLKVTFILLSNISKPNLRWICWAFLNISPEVLYSQDKGRVDLWFFSYHCPPPLDVLVYSPVQDKGNSFPYWNFENLNNLCLYRKKFIKFGDTFRFTVVFKNILKKGQSASRMLRR